jgi:hypothetical protein
MLNKCITDQIKIMEEYSLVFTSIWFVIYLWLSSEKYKIMSWKKKALQDLRFFCVEVWGFYFFFKELRLQSALRLVTRKAGLSQKHV